jgi:protein-L-isoaspartate(D-aspartate) O-methyltransferase
LTVLKFWASGGPRGRLAKGINILAGAKGQGSGAGSARVRETRSGADFPVRPGRKGSRVGAWTPDPIPLVPTSSAPMGVKMDDGQFEAPRAVMVEDILLHARLARAEIGKEALGADVMRALASVPRHDFVPAELRVYAYADTPLPIGHGKTISQPFIVALMTDLLELKPGDKVLEIGTGFGYQAAVLAALGCEVYSVESIEELSAEAAKRLARCGYKNVTLKVGDGYYGWPEHGPFDRIILTAAPELVPPPLFAQLKPGGRMVVPAGMAQSQQLILALKDASGRIVLREILPVRFSALDPVEREE